MQGISSARAKADYEDGFGTGKQEEDTFGKEIFLIYHLETGTVT